MNKKILIILLSFFLHLARADVEVFNLSDHKVINLNPKHPLFKDKLDYIAYLVKMNMKPQEQDKIESVTYKEARQYFAPYFKQKLGQAKYNKVSDKLFTSAFFGKSVRDICKTELKSHTKSLYTHKDFLTPRLIWQLRRAAETIMQKSKAGDILVIFGNSPTFLGKALEFLSSHDKHSVNYRQIIYLPFSGAPNAMRTKPHAYNFVTPERLLHLKHRLQNLGLASNNKDLANNSVYFIDIICAASGISYVVEILLRDFEAAGKPYPDLNIISINEININSHPRNSLIALKNAKDKENITFYLPSIMDTHFAISGYVAYIKDYQTLDRLDSDELRIVPEYHPSYWNDYYDRYLKKPLSSKMLELIKYLNDQLSLNEGSK
jgi:hypothetical protein